MTRDELLKKICPWGTCDCGDDYESCNCNDCNRVLEEWLYDYEKHVIEQYKANINLKNKQLIDKVIDELELHSFELGTDTLPVHYVRLNESIEIVKQGGVSDVSDDVCEWRFEDEEANLYLTGCQQRQLIFEGTPKENGYRYCHYCGKKILCKE